MLVHLYFVLVHVGPEWVEEYLATAPTKTNVQLAFHQAVSNGDTAAVKVLCDNALIKVNKTNADGSTPLFVAGSLGHIEIVHLLLGHPMINALTRSGCDSTPLHGALTKNMNTMEVVTTLLNTGLFDVNDPMNGGITPLLLACWANLPEVAELLLALGSDPNVISDSGTSPLSCACSQGFTDLVRVLLRVPEIDVNCRYPLLKAVSGSFSAIVDLLLAVPTIKVNEPDKRNCPPLEVAYRKHDDDIITSLLSHPDIEINNVNKYQQTVLHVAVKKGNVKRVRQLLQIENMNVNSRMNGDMTALHAAIHLPRRVELKDAIVCELLSCQRVDVNFPEEPTSLAPLHVALQSGSPSIVQAFLERSDIDIMYKDCHGTYPLHTASKNGLFRAVNFLCDRAPAIVNARCEPDGYTPLHCAADSETDCVEVVCRLLQCPDVYVNLVTTSGRTAFHLACGRGHLLVVKAFLKVPELDCTLLSHEGTSPFHDAVSSCSNEVVRFLLQQPWCDVNSMTGTGFHPLHLATSRCDVEFSNILLGIETSSINARCEDHGSTPLHTACSASGLTVVEELLRCPTITPNVVEGAGRTPLHLASEKGFVEVVNALLNVTDTQISPIIPTSRMSPLSFAVDHGFLDLIKTLMSNPKMDMNYELQHTISPLRIAAFRGRLPIVRALLDCEDVLNTWTPRHLSAALQGGHNAVVMELLCVPMRQLGLSRAEEGVEQVHLERWDAASFEVITGEKEREIYRGAIRRMMEEIAENVRVHLKENFLGRRLRIVFLHTI